MFASATGFIVANSIAGALNGFPQRAGAVSALVGALQYGSGILGSGLVGAFADGTPWPMGWVIALAGIGSLVSTRLVRPDRSLNAG
jgi:MFS transporter, DHA1 family, multidrug resistance protein